MDIEKTVEFLLEHQAKAAIEIDAIRGLIGAGMRLLADVQAEQKRSDEKITQLAAAQLVTEEKLQAFLDAQRRGGNGHD